MKFEIEERENGYEMRYSEGGAFSGTKRYVYDSLDKVIEAIQTKLRAKFGD